MEQNTTQRKIAEVLQKIQKDNVSIHSKNFFRLKFIAFIFLLITICFTSIFLCSFILFTIRMSGQSDFVSFGSQGVLLFFVLFPWFLFVFDLFLIGMLGMLMRQTSFGYKIPGIYIVAMIFGIIIISGYVVESKTSLHRSMLFRADRKQLPLFEGAYIKIRRAPPVGYGIYRGVVIHREGDVLYVDIDDSEGVGTTTSVTVNISNDSRAPHIEQGDSVFIAGKIVNGTVTEAHLKMAPRLPPPR